MSGRYGVASPPITGLGPATLRRFMWWTTLSSFGSGLVLPLTALYLAEQTSLGTGGVAAYFAVMAITELAISGALAVVRTVMPPGLLAGAGYLVLGAGYAALALGPDLVGVVLIALVVGIGRGTSSGGVPAFLRQVLGTEEFRDGFARRYRALNFGLGLGLLTATVALSVLPVSIIPTLFVVNGLTFVPLAVFLLLRRRAAASDDPPPPATIGALRLIRMAGPICVVDFCVFAFAYSQFDSALPLTTVRLQDATIGFVSAMVAVNTVTVVVLQRPVTRVIERWSSGRGMQIALALWVVGYAVALAASLRPGWVSWSGLVVLAVLFACGECAYAASFQPWLLAAVPPAEATRASSLANVCSSLGLSLGPSLGVLLVGTGHAAVVWGVLVVACLVTMLLVAIVLALTRNRTAGERTA